MAITLKTNGSEFGASILSLFGVSPGYVAAAKDYGIVIECSNPTVYKILAGPNHVYIGTLHIKGSAMTLVKSGKMGKASKEAYKNQIEDYIKKGVDWVKTFGNGTFNHASTATTMGVTVPVLEAFPKKATTVTGAKKPSVKAKALPDPIAVDDSPVSAVISVISPSASVPSSSVDLKDAFLCYQQVKGTSVDSVYVVAMVFKGLNVAIKVVPKHLSVRAEGSALDTYSAAMADLGMDSKGHYYSGHYVVSSRELMLKTLGAFMVSLGVSRLIKAADFSALIKMGWKT